MVQTHAEPAGHPYDDIPEAVKRMTPVTNFDEIQDILGSRDFAMAGRDNSMPFFFRTLIMLEGNEHSDRRRSEAKHFRPEVLVNDHSRDVHGAIDFVLRERIGGATAGEVVRVELVEFVMRVQTLVMARFVGLALPDDDDAQLSDDLDALVAIMPIVNKSGALTWTRKDLIEETNVARHAVMEWNDRFVMPAIRRLRSQSHPAGHADGLLGTLVELYDPGTWDGEQIAREARVFMTAGVRTSAHTVLDALPHLIEWREAHPEAVEQSLDTSSDFLNRVVSESLRLNAPNPTIMRRALASGETPSGVAYEEGQQFALYTGIGNRDTSVFGEDANEFNPLRTPRKGVPLWGFGFGHGHHACIGRSLALGRVSPDGAQHGYEGSTVTTLRELVRHGVQPVPGEEPHYEEDTFKKMCATYPAYLRG